MSNKKPNFLDLYKDQHYRIVLVDSLCKGIGSKYDTSFRNLVNYIIEEKYHLFDREEFHGALYLNEDETLDLVLPAVRRVFGKIFIDVPTLFKESYTEVNYRYNLFVLYFNPDEFIDYLIDMFIKSKDCLKHFEFIDKTSETLTLIVDNYVAELVHRVQQIHDHKQAFENLLKQKNRDTNLNKIFEKNL